jgi:nucleoside-triphosphatase
VGRYGVDLEALERIALPELARRADTTLIDELGKMELASEPFRDAVLELFDAHKPVVATVHAFRHPFSDALKARPDVELVRLTRGNRDELPELIAGRLMRPAE